MLKRLHIYLKEMLPLYQILLAGVILFFEIYFLIIFITDVDHFSVGIQEIVGCFTVCAFMLSLRIADDFKDLKTDRVLFPERPLPSGRVKISDLVTLLVVVNVIAITGNILFMNNLAYYAVLMAYGTLMSVWFFARSKIQKNLFLALITHNPVDVIVNIYIISFTCIKYDLPILTFNNVLIAFTLYWPTLIWEMARKTRAPQDETDYVTYSKLYGYVRVTQIILVIITLDLVTSARLMYELWAPGLIAVVAAWAWFVWRCWKFIKDPTSLKLVNQIEIYELITEVPVIAIEVVYILARSIR